MNRPLWKVQQRRVRLERQVKYRSHSARNLVSCLPGLQLQMSYCLPHLLGRRSRFHSLLKLNPDWTNQRMVTTPIAPVTKEEHMTGTMTLVRVGDRENTLLTKG